MLRSFNEQSYRQNARRAEQARRHVRESSVDEHVIATARSCESCSDDRVGLFDVVCVSAC